MNCWDVIIMAKFKKGDSVRCIESYEELDKGMKGTVVDLWGIDWIGVEWEDFHDGHNCNNQAADGTGYYLPSYCLELLDIDILNE